MEPEGIDLTALDEAGLDAAERTAVEEFNARRDQGATTATDATDLAAIAERINALRTERGVRAEAASSIAALADMVNTVSGPTVPEDAEPTPVVPEDAQALEGELITASGDNVTPRASVSDVLANGTRLNASLASNLAAASRHVPAVATPAPRSESVLVASADIPGFTMGGRIDTMDGLIEAVHNRARMLPDHSGPVPIASLRREFSYTLHDRSTNAEVSQILDTVRDPEILVAAGGWCAPSQISYDFYNIVCEDGLIDLPTIGITRGGFQWPTSPSFGDVADQIWTWTETQDIAAVTGTAQSGTKPCYRVACPAYNNARLACDGLCLTMGNLMNDAFPELVSNQMRLLFAAQAHYTNNRIIGQLVTGSTSVVYETVTGHGVAAPVLEAVEMQVIDYRIKYRMCDGAILEAIFPTWILPMFRADLAKRVGLAEFNVTDDMIIGWFNSRGVRVQLVQDWQVGTTGLPGQSTAITAWPTSVQFLLYAAGTWIRGNGLSLDLGVIRDSVLNATNDFTAAWMEECYLTALVGHESRIVTVPICANGATQAGITMGCSL